MRTRPTIREIWISTIGSLFCNAILWFFGLFTAYLISKPDVKLTEVKLLITTILNEKISVWVVLCIFSIIIFGTFIIKLFHKRPFLKVTEMNVNGLNRTWRWKYDEEEKGYYVYDLQTYCPSCHNVLSCDIYATPAYQCINGHSLDTEKILYQQSMDYITDTIRKQYPTYKNIIIMKEE